MAVKYSKHTNIFHSKSRQNVTHLGIFGLETIYHLATLEMSCSRIHRYGSPSSLPSQHATFSLSVLLSINLSTFLYHILLSDVHPGHQFSSFFLAPTASAAVGPALPIVLLCLSIFVVCILGQGGLRKTRGGRCSDRNFLKTASDSDFILFYIWSSQNLRQKWIFVSIL
jgi:hypothetical protein